MDRNEEGARGHDDHGQGRPSSSGAGGGEGGGQRGSPDAAVRQPTGHTTHIGPPPAQQQQQQHDEPKRKRDSMDLDDLLINELPYNFSYGDMAKLDEGLATPRTPRGGRLGFDTLPFSPRGSPPELAPTQQQQQPPHERQQEQAVAAAAYFECTLCPWNR